MNGAVISSPKISFRPSWAVWAALLFLALPIAMAGRECLSALYAIQARHDFETWLKNPATAPVEHYENARNHMTTALRIDPGNPFLHEDLGRLLDAGAVHLKSLSQEQRVRAWRESAAEFRAALILRPVSPYSWSSLALVKSRLGERDAETQQALRQAARFGPWEPEVQRGIADAGWAGWNVWPEDLRQILIENAVRGGKRQRDAMLRIVVHHRQQNEVCMNLRLFEALRPGWCG